MNEMIAAHGQNSFVSGWRAGHLPIGPFTPAADTARAFLDVCPQRSRCGGAPLALAA
jgi:hypothetical protein